MPTEQEVAAKLQELVDRLEEADDGVRAKLSDAVASKIIQIEVADIDAAFWSELEGGRMDGPHEGSTPDADIRIRADSQTLVDLIDGRRSLFSSYVAGHVRIDASMGDLLALRKLL